MKHLLILLPLWAAPSAFAQQDSAKIYFEKGKAEKSAKKYLVATQSFEKAVKFNPSYTEAILEQGLAFLEMRKLDAAKNCFEKVHQLQPGNTNAVSELTNLYYSYRQYAKAIEFAQKCIGCTNASRIIGMSYHQQEDYAQAEKFLRSALDKNPADAEATYTLARNYVEMEQYNKAIPMYETAIKLDVSKNSWIYELGLLYYNQNDYRNAVASFRSAADNGYVQSNDFKENLGFASLHTGDFEKGEQLVLEIWSKKPGNTDLIRDMADVFYRQKQYDRSLIYCQKLMEIDSRDGKALYQAGLNFQRKGQKDRGQQMCDRAIELDPSLDGLRKKKEMSGL